MYTTNFIDLFEFSFSTYLIIVKEDNNSHKSVSMFVDFPHRLCSFWKPMSAGNFGCLTMSHDDDDGKILGVMLLMTFKLSNPKKTQESKKHHYVYKTDKKPDIIS